MTPETAEQIVPAVIVVIAYTNTSLPAGARQARFVSDVSKCAVTIVFEKLRCWRLPLRPLLAKMSSIGQVDIEPPVVVIVKERDSASLSFNDVALVIGRAP